MGDVEGGESESQPQPESNTAPCPECHAPLAPGAVLCIACGYDLQAGRRLETVRAPSPDELLLKRPSKETEYAPPDVSLAAPLRKKELERNLDLETRVFWLEERLRELERRVGGTRLTASDFATRMFAVFGHWFVAFLALAFFFGALLALMGVLSRVLPSLTS